MNTRKSVFVPAPRFIAVLVLLWASLCGQCDINGGATELTWSLRTFQSDSISCGAAQVDKIRLCWSPESGDTSCRDFPCDKLTGVTLFEIPAGPNELVVAPVCADGDPAAENTYQAPPGIVRHVRNGEVVNLNLLLIVVTDPKECVGRECTCTR